MIRAHLLRWRPRRHAQRTSSTPRVPPSGAASQLDPSHSPAGCERTTMRVTISLLLLLAVVASVAAGTLATQGAPPAGVAGKGDPCKGVPDRTGQPPGYLRNQMLLFKADRRSPGDEHLKALKTLMRTIPDQQIADLAAYWSSVRQVGLADGAILVGLGLAIGAFGTLIGAGGGFLLVPLLVLGYHFPPAQAVG